MTIKEIKDSGLLEYYVIGIASTEEISTVEQALRDFPILKQDLVAIEKALHVYGQIHSIDPRDGLRAELINSIRNQKQDFNPNNNIGKGNGGKKPGSSGFGILSALLSLLALGAIWMAYNQSNKADQYERNLNAQKITCDSTAVELERTKERLSELYNPNNTILPMVATDNYQETNLYFHYNPTDKKNYIQIKNLPQINNDQAFQLWSLKPDTDPIPLTVFSSENGVFIVPVDFEDDTQTYAITIEQAGGAQSPNLAQLIGTVTVA